MPRSLSTLRSASALERRPTPRYSTLPSAVTNVARSCCCSEANSAGKCWRFLIDSFGAWNFVATSIDAHWKPSSWTTIVAPIRAGESQCTARSSRPWATAGSRSGAHWRKRRQQRGGGRTVGPRLPVPRDDAALGEQADLAEHQGALHDAGAGDLLQLDELGLVLHRPVEADEHRAVVVAVDDERRAPVGERAGHLAGETVERHEVGDAAGGGDAHAGRHRERAVQRAPALEHRDAPGVVELVEQQVADAVVLVELDPVLFELLGEAAGRSGEQLVGHAIHVTA